MCVFIMLILNGTEFSWVNIHHADNPINHKYGVDMCAEYEIMRLFLQVIYGLLFSLYSNLSENYLNLRG